MSDAPDDDTREPATEADVLALLAEHTEKYGADFAAAPERSFWTREQLVDYFYGEAARIRGLAEQAREAGGA